MTVLNHCFDLNKRSGAICDAITFISNSMYKSHPFSMLELLIYFENSIINVCIDFNILNRNFNGLTV